MTSPGDDALHDENRLLLRFCTAVLQTADTPALINIVADDADFVRVCKQLASPPSRAMEVCFLALCNQRGFDAATIRCRVSNISRALRLNPNNGAPADYYAILGVPAHADDKAIKHAFREKAKVVHPDRQAENSDAFLDLQTAYHHLSDTHLRRRYDDECRGRCKWSEPAETQPRRPAAYGRPLGMIGALLAALVTAAFLLDLFYNETSFFSGPEPAAPTLASVDPGSPLAAQPSPARIDHAGQWKGAAAARESHRLQMATVTDFGAADPAAAARRSDSSTPVQALPASTPVDGPGSPAKAAVQHLAPMLEPTPAPALVHRQTTAGPNTRAQPPAAKRRAPPEPARSAAPSKPRAGVERPAASATTPVLPLEQRLRAFLNRYCEVYASKDLENFFTFFTPDATEQGQPLEAMLPAYRETFSKIKRVDYHIQIQAFTPHPQTGRVHVDGLFQAHYELKNGGTGDSSGTVFMDLAERDEGFRVCNLKYVHQ